jgi:hypothetical protein
LLKTNRSFYDGGSFLGEKVARRPTLFAQRMKSESGFLGLLYPLAKKLLNNMFYFPHTLLIKKIALYINYIIYPIIYDQ